MNIFSMLGIGRNNDEWKRAVGVLPIERALADEHEAMHGETLHLLLDAVPLEFDADQFIDIPGMARDLLGARDSGFVEVTAEGSRLLRGSALTRAVDDHAMAVLEAKTAAPDEPNPSRAAIRFDAKARTPRDDVGKFVLDDTALSETLKEYEAQAGDGRCAQAHPLADALARRFNQLLGKRLVDEPVFQTFVDAGAVQALGDVPSGLTAAATEAELARRASRSLLEAAFPNEIQRMRDRRLKVVFDATRQHDTAALCLSGGGIRSSTFALGIMQGLARHKLLGKFDYLSTVSGGGLSGGWLSAWMKRDGAKAVHEALRASSHEKVRPKIQPEPEPVRALRAFSNWLTPEAGAASVDSWTVIATVIRNLLLNWLVLLPLMAGVVMAPRLLQALLALDFRPPEWWRVAMVVGFGGGTLLMVASGAFLVWARSGPDALGSGWMGSPSPGQFFGFFLVPRILGSVLLALTFYVGSAWDHVPLPPSGDIDTPIVRTFVAVVFTLFVVIGALSFVWALVRRRKRSARKALQRTLKVSFSSLVGYVVPFAFLASGWSHELTVMLAPALVLLGSVVASQLYTGLTGDEASDAEREWAARANAFILVVAIAWMVASGLVLFGPRLLSGAVQKLTLVGVGGIASWLTVILSKSAGSAQGGTASTGGKVRGLALALAAPAVVACLVIGLAALNEGSLRFACTRGFFNDVRSCTPAPEVKDTSLVPLSAMLSQVRADVAIEGADAFVRSLDADSANSPRDAEALTQARIHDSTLVQASQSYTAAMLEWVHDEMGHVQRNEDGSAKGGAMDEAEQRVHAAVRSHSERRGARLSAVFNDSLGDSGDRFSKLGYRVLALHRAQDALATDSLIKSDMAVRSAAWRTLDDAFGAVSDSTRTAAAVRVSTEEATFVSAWWLMVALLAVGLVLSFLINTNTFSLHAMWRARTVRAFLGTTRAPGDRSPNPFTGFDSDDDLALRDLWPARVSTEEASYAGDRSEWTPPMHVLNVTLNLAAGRNLAWQQRKAESMTLTPLHGGSAFAGYRPMRSTDTAGTSRRIRAGYGGPDGVTLGTAMAISGAAASPSDGSYTTPLGSFLMTFFNARLGRWLGNPGAPGGERWTRKGMRKRSAAMRNVEPWQRSAPLGRLRPILSEMFGRTSDRSPYVYLSDGGHFENLALYEMVLRRNRFILVSDGGGDPDYTFEDLGNAVRKIRIDFGVPIEFESGLLIRGRSPDGSPGAYWATARIRYSAVDMPLGGANPDAYDGVLVYVKAAAYLDEERDVVNYARQNPSFPQESSADQNFSEAQFESYRALGAWIVDRLVGNPAAGGAPVVVTAARDGSLLKLWPNLADASKGPHADPTEPIASTPPVARTPRIADPP